MASISINVSAELDYSKRAYISKTVNVVGVESLNELEESFNEEMTKTRREITEQLDAIKAVDAKRASESGF